MFMSYMSKLETFGSYALFFPIFLSLFSHLCLLSGYFWAQFSNLNPPKARKSIFWSGVVIHIIYNTCPADKVSIIFFFKSTQYFALKGELLFSSFGPVKLFHGHWLCSSSIMHHILAWVYIWICMCRISQKVPQNIFFPSTF